MGGGRLWGGQTKGGGGQIPSHGVAFFVCFNENNGEDLESDDLDNATEYINGLFAQYFDIEEDYFQIFVAFSEYMNFTK